MTDNVLLELERLTRHPVDLIGFQVKTNNLVVAKADNTNSETKNSDHVIDAVFSEPVNRREFIAYSASGLRRPRGLLMISSRSIKPALDYRYRSSDFDTRI